MFGRIKRVLKKDIIKVSSFTALSTLVKMFTGFISVKIVAVIVGPAGIALLGQLNNFSNIIMTIASGGINNGVTKYIAEYKDSELKIRVFIRTAIWITLLLSLSGGLFLIIGAHYLSQAILKSGEFSDVFVVFGFTLILYSFNNLLLSILNGYKEFKKYVCVGIISSITGLAFSVCLVLLFNIHGALISAVTFQSVVFIVTLLMVIKSKWFHIKNFWGRYSFVAGKKLFKFSAMTLVSAATIPVSQLLVRGFLVSCLNFQQAGIWEGMNRVSGMYLLVITTSLGVYYLPRLSEIKNSGELRKEVVSAYKIVAPSLLVVAVIIFLCRNLVIHILFSKDFFEMNRLFLYQLSGDFFKVMSWLLGFILLAKAMTKTYIAIEIFFAASFVILSHVLIPLYGIQGPTIAYMINNIVLFILMLIIFRKLLFGRNESGNQ